MQGNSVPIRSSTATVHRCGWVGTEPLYRTYHDREWGVPVHDDRLLFEFLTLEGAQAGLSWITILKKRDAYRAAFAGGIERWTTANFSIVFRGHHIFRP